MASETFLFFVWVLFCMAHSLGFLILFSKILRVHYSPMRLWGCFAMGFGFGTTSFLAIPTILQWTTP